MDISHIVHATKCIRQVSDDAKLCQCGFITDHISVDVLIWHCFDNVVIILHWSEINYTYHYTLVLMPLCVWTNAIDYNIPTNVQTNYQNVSFKMPTHSVTNVQTRSTWLLYTLMASPQCMSSYAFVGVYRRHKDVYFFNSLRPSDAYMRH